MLKRISGNFYKYQSSVTKLALLLIVGFIYYIITQVTSFYIPCPIRTLTGFVCPGCGITHFFIDLINLNFINAMQQNLAIFVLLVIWILVGIIYMIFRPQSLKKGGRVFNILIWSSVILLVVFGILRNIPELSFLLPLYLQ